MWNHDIVFSKERNQLTIPLSEPTLSKSVLSQGFLAVLSKTMENDQSEQLAVFFNICIFVD